MASVGSPLPGLCPPPLGSSWQIPVKLQIYKKMWSRAWGGQASLLVHISAFVMPVLQSWAASWGCWEKWLAFNGRSRSQHCEVPFPEMRYLPWHIHQWGNWGSEGLNNLSKVHSSENESEFKPKNFFTCVKEQKFNLIRFEDLIGFIVSWIQQHPI